MPGGAFCELNGLPLGGFVRSRSKSTMDDGPYHPTCFYSDSSHENDSPYALNLKLP